MRVVVERAFALKTMANFAFIEYSYNSSIENEDVVFDRLNQLGFSLRSKHNFQPVTFWSQGTSILMLRDDEQLPVSGQITGIGLVASRDDIVSHHDSVPCPVTDFFKINFPVMGFNLYLLEEGTLGSLTELTYTRVDDDFYKVKGHNIMCFSGIEFDSDNERLKNVLESLGFVDDSSNRNRFISPNKSFTVLFRFKGNNKATSLICDTQDIFKTTASMSFNGVNFLKIDQEPEGFKELTHKIIGYDCAVFGNYNTHSIEKYIPIEPGFNASLIARQRKQFTKLEDTTFEYYDSIKEEQQS